MRAIRRGRLALEPQTREHADAMFAVLRDPALYAYEGDPPASADALRERFARLESRSSSDGRQRWLNWVVRLDGRELIGYVQATVLPGGDALIAYVLASAWWGQGLAAGAVEAMAGELARRHGVHTLWAVFKNANARSRRLLERLGFEAVPEGTLAPGSVEADESAMRRAARAGAKG